MPSESPSPTVPASPVGGNVPAYSVSELSGALKRTIETAYGHVRVRGEISACKRHSSGHLYLCLKDTDAVIDAVCWRGTVSKLSIAPADGLEVIATGRITTYPGRSRYQLIIEQMELAGEGAILKMLEDRRRRLAAEGLFDAERKRPLPYLPDVIGVITSPTGAVIRDILHRLAERFPRHVLVWPVAVQGETAAREVAAAIAGFNGLPIEGPVPRPDLLIVARGGGSLEDLMAFNDEAVVRAAAASTIPLISAVGHETDTTLIDFASDRRAPTPTAAAEIAVPVRLDLLAETTSLGSRLNGAATRLLSERRLHLAGLSRGLGDPLRLVETATQRLDDRAERLTLAMAGSLAAKGSKLAHAVAGLKHPRQQIAEHARRMEIFTERLKPALERLMIRAEERMRAAATHYGNIQFENLIGQGHAKTRQLSDRLNASAMRVAAASEERLGGVTKLLNSLSPYAVLKRGYALVEDSSGHILDAPSIEPGMPLNLRFYDKIIPAVAAASSETKEVLVQPPAIRKTKGRDPELAVRQPSLF